MASPPSSRAGGRRFPCHARFVDAGSCVHLSITLSGRPWVCLRGARFSANLFSHPVAPFCLHCLAQNKALTKYNIPSDSGDGVCRRCMPAQIPKAQGPRRPGQEASGNGTPIRQGAGWFSQSNSHAVPCQEWKGHRGKEEGLNISGLSRVTSHKKGLIYTSEITSMDQIWVSKYCFQQAIICNTGPCYGFLYKKSMSDLCWIDLNGTSTLANYYLFVLISNWYDIHFSNWYDIMKWYHCTSCLHGFLILLYRI